MAHMPTFDPPDEAAIDSALDWLNVTDYGAVGDGVTDDAAAIRTAITAVATAGGRYLYFPAGIYNVSRDGSNSYSIDVTASNITFLGVRGKSWIRHPTGMPNASVAIVRVQSKSNVSFINMGFDGNWGNAVTTVSLTSDNVALPQATINVLDTTDFPSSGTFGLVINGAAAQTITYTGKTSTTFTGCSGGSGQLRTHQVCGYVDADTGINHTTQGDPKNYGLMIRGCTDVLVDQCLFKNCYGDAIWVGATSTSVLQRSRNVRVMNSTSRISARSGIALAQGCHDVVIQNCRFEHVFAQAFDTEPVGPFSPVQNVVVDNCYLDSWWNNANLTRSQNSPLSIVGGDLQVHQAHAARNFRVTNCTIRGSAIVERSIDTVIENTHFFADWDGYSFPLVYCAMLNDNVRIKDNYFYRRAQSATGPGPTAAIAVADYQVSSTHYQPQSVSVVGNHIKCVNGNFGIAIWGTGGQAGDSGTASGTTATTLTDSGKAWSVNQWQGHKVRIGAYTSTVDSNTATVLTISGGWFTPFGDLYATPAAGAYVIEARSSMIDVDNNFIDCGNDGYGAGGDGMQLQNIGSGAAPGYRLRVRGNTIKNATGAGIRMTFGATTAQHIEITNNHGMDDQGTPTMTSLIDFDGTPLSDRFILAGNTKDDGITNLISGLSSGVWLVSNGEPAIWAGYGSPEGVVTATVGSIYSRVDGSVTYTKVSGSSNTGWFAEGLSTTVTSGNLTLVNVRNAISVTGTQAYTLPNGLFAGQRCIAECTVAASTPIGTLTVTTAFSGDPTTYIFNAVGQRVEFEWNGSAWRVVRKIRVGSQTVILGTDSASSLVAVTNLSVTGTVSGALPNGAVIGETVEVRCTTAAATPNGSLTGVYKGLDAASTTAAAFDSTADYFYATWNGSRWLVTASNSVTFS